MRPEVLYPLFASIETLPGIGSKMAKLIEKLAGDKVVDLCWHLPAGLIDRRYSPPIPEAPDGAVVTLTLTIGKHSPPPNRRVPYRIRAGNESGTIDLVFFHAKEDYLRRTLPEGETRIVSGRMERFRGKAQMSHPDHVLKSDEADEMPVIEPVYPLTTGLSPKVLYRAIRAALRTAPALEEWLDPALRKKQGWTDWQEALLTAHSPEKAADLEPEAPARLRLAYDELLANQLALMLVRAHMKRSKGRAMKGGGELRAKLREALPYALTPYQEEALEEILADMGDGIRMMRLLQGDVGSGKTVVALLAMLNAVETSAQAALAAPTEILARQHYAAIGPLAARLGLKVGLLTGRTKGKERQQLLADLAGGAMPLVIGTHALFEENVEFRDLGLAVIDEQHRFGVHQRMSLSGKGRAAVDMLVMTATPIPRTLTLTVYGDMDVSRITGKPPGRQPIDTRTIPLARLEEVIGSLRRAIEGGARIYWVCPLVEESEKLDLAAAEARFAQLKKKFADRVGLVHGRMKGPEKDAVMADFSAGRIDILVATTVIEVGVDVTEATVMVIEQAERFGLAQLHQLRGRIGRGGGKSTCLLLYGAELSENARSRLRIMRETEDGFRIAEEDLRLRGAGELLGTRQSGFPEFRLADVEAHGEWLQTARDDAALIIERDRDLQSDRGRALRTLLYLFERDAAVGYLRSG